MAIPTSSPTAGFATRNPLHLFIVSGLSACCGEFATLPIDMIKVRQQVYGTKVHEQLAKHGPNIFSVFTRIVKETGVFSLWQGATPALLRQITYGSLRIGLYEPIKTSLANGERETYALKTVPIWKKVVSAALSGMIAAALCTPTDVLKIRMQASDYFGYHYRNTASVFLSIFRNEGIRGLYNSWFPTSVRAGVVSVAELITYDEAKHFFVGKCKLEDGPRAHLGASLVTGLVSTTVVSPVDFIKTRMQSQPLDSNGKGVAYRNALDCLHKSMVKEGPLVLWRGFSSHYLRRGPHLVVTMSAFEQFRIIADRWEGLE